MMFAAGIDVGSTQTKAIILDGNLEVVGRSLLPTGAHITRVGEEAYKEALKNSYLPKEEIGAVIGTGYGRYKVTFGDTQITEISCHARGSHFLFPGTRTVIDMGGQDTKAIKVGPKGEVLDFSMNDKCAAGTGRFLSSAAEVLDLTLEEIGPLSLEAVDPVRLTSVCAVFVESDIMSYLAQGFGVRDILGGVHRAIGARVVSLVRRVGIEKDVTFTGGVSKNVGMVRALEELLETSINVSEESHYAGALGAALFALERISAEGKKHEPIRFEKWADDEGM